MRTLVECPYDKTHMICPLRMPNHLLRCRKNHPYMELVVCPFNATHEVHQAELRYHMTNCPNRTLLEREFTLRVLLAADSDQPVTQLKGCTDLPNPTRRRPETDMVGDEWDRELEQSHFSLFRNTDSDDSSEDDPRRRLRLRDDDAEARRPTTLGEAARLSQVPCQDEKRPQAAGIRRREDLVVHSSLALGRGRARTVTNPDVPARPGVSYRYMPPASLVNSQMGRATTPGVQSDNSSAAKSGVQCAPSVALPPYQSRSCGRGFSLGRGFKLS